MIPAGGRYHMVKDGDTCYLKIDNVSVSDTGVYTCIVSNNQGKSSSSAALKMEGKGQGYLLWFFFQISVFYITETEQHYLRICLKRKNTNFQHLAPRL